MTESSRIERLPPQNVEAEEAILGRLLIDPDAIIRVATILQTRGLLSGKERLDL